MQLRNDRSELSDAEFLQLIEAKSDSFYRVAYGYVRNPEDAKDIVQEAVCKAYAGKKRLRERDKFYPWFYRILAHTAVSFLRKHARAVAWEEELLEAPEPQEERWSDRLWVKDSLGRIEAKCQAIQGDVIVEARTGNNVPVCFRTVEDYQSSCFLDQYYEVLLHAETVEPVLDFMDR